MYDFFQIFYMKIYQNKTNFCFGFWALGCPKKQKNKKDGLIDGLSLLGQKDLKHLYFW